MAQTPSLAEVIAAAIEARLARVSTAEPGIVQSYNAKLACADIQPAVRQIHYDEEGDRIAERKPVIPDVPVIFPGASGYSDTWPLSPGDLVLLVSCSASIDRFMADGELIDPLLEVRHHIGDSFAIAGVIRPRNKPLKPTPPSNARVITAPKLKLGSANATKKVALAPDVEAALKGVLKNSGLATAMANVAAGVPGAQAALEVVVELHFENFPLNGASKVEAE